MRYFQPVSKAIVFCIVKFVIKPRKAIRLQIPQSVESNLYNTNEFFGAEENDLFDRVWFPGFVSRKTVSDCRKPFIALWIYFADGRVNYTMYASPVDN